MKRAPSSVASVIVLTLVLITGRVAANAATPTRARSAGRASASAASKHHVYYVATNGSDAHAGTRAHPFRTIQRGLNRAHAGDTVIVRAGRYQPARFVRGGKTGAPITLRGLRGVLLRGDGSGTGLVVSDVSHVVVRGLTVVNFEVGIAVDDASAVVVTKNTASGNDDTGIQTTGSRHVLVVGNRLVDRGLSPGVADQDYGVNFYFSRYVVARHNYFFGRHNQALSFKRRVYHGSAIRNTFEGCLLTCLYIGQNDDDSEGDMTSSHITVQGNRFRAIRKGGTYYLLRTPITVRNVRYALVRYNIFDPSCELGVYYSSSPQQAGLAVGRNKVRHNKVKRWRR